MMAPTKTYCLRRPHFERVLSEINPIIGSVIESNIRGKKNKIPHKTGEKPIPSIRIIIKTPNAAGNIWLANIPNPKAIFWDIGTFVVGWLIVLMFIRACLGFPQWVHFKLSHFIFYNLRCW